MHRVPSIQSNRLGSEKLHAQSSVLQSSSLVMRELWRRSSSTTSSLRQVNSIIKCRIAYANAGESFFMAANEPHAYVAGEILECMACSDNVVRAGLTPKHKDVENLVEMLTYTMGGPDIEFGRLEHSDQGSHTLVYTPPVPEFEVLVTTVEPGHEYAIPPLNVPSILICVEGIGSTRSAPGPDGEEPLRAHQYELKPGQSLYISAGTISLVLICDGKYKGPLRVARARQNLNVST